MLKALILLSFIVLIFAGIFAYTSKTANNIEQDIMTNVHTSLSSNDFKNIFVTVDGRNVTLNGTAPDTRTRSNIEDTARSVSGVISVNNNISIVASKSDSKKGLSLSNALSSNKKEETDIIKDPIVLDIIKCDPAVCAKATKKTEGNVK